MFATLQFCSKPHQQQEFIQKIFVLCIFDEENLHKKSSLEKTFDQQFFFLIHATMLIVFVFNLEARIDIFFRQLVA